jgi:hypothetical protein
MSDAKLIPHARAVVDYKDIGGSHYQVQRHVDLDQPALP